MLLSIVNSESNKNCELIIEQRDLWYGFYFCTNNFENYKGLIVQKFKCTNSSSSN